MAAKKVKRAVAARKGVPAEAGEAAEAGGARVFPLAALRAALGTEVDRVRKYGGYTLILRRGRAVAAVIPYEEFERLTMQDRNRKDRKNTNARSAPRQMTPTELIAEVESIRAAIAADWAKNGRPPESSLDAAELIRKSREERTNQILRAARGTPVGRKRRGQAEA